MITEKSNAALCLVPLDISTEILSRLPVKSLLRFKCVRKSWCNIIEDPNFISIHLKRFGKNKNGFLLCNSFNYEFFKHYRGNNNNVGREENLMSSRSLFRKRRGYIVGAINGLVCLVDAFFSFYRDEISRPIIRIWNPSTRKIMELPGCDYRLEHCMTAYHVFGFGFCLKTNDYKVIKITGDNFIQTPLEVGLYTLSTNSWKYMTITNPGWVLLPLLESSVVITFVNGASHWLGNRIRSPGRGKMFIMSFKFDREMFQEIEIPISNLKDPKNSVYFVTKYENLLSLISQKVIGKFDIWVMKEYGVAESWIKQFTIELPSIQGYVRMIEPSVFSFENNNGIEVLLLYYENDNERRRVVWYNVETKQIEDKGLHPFMQVISCKESLVSLP